MEAMSENCVNCFNRHITSVATHWCSFCSEGLCFLCTEHHEASKILKSHSIMPISDYQKLPYYIRDIQNCCETHEEPFQLYCRTHEQCCCLSCVKETHNGCKSIETLNDVVSGVKSSPALEEIDTSLKTIIGIYDNFRENRIENKSRLSEQREKIIAEVHNIRKSINDHLDKLVNAIETTISTEFEAANLKIAELLTEVEGRQENIRQLIEEEEVIKQLSTDLQTFVGLTFFQCRIQEETKYIETLKREHRTDELDLAFHSNDLDSFCENIDLFGTVAVSQGLCKINLEVGKKEMAQIIVPKDELFDKLVSNIHQMEYPERDFIRIKITGCMVLPSGQMLFVDNINGELFMMNESSLEEEYREICSINDIFDVTYIENSKAAVTSISKKQIAIVDLLMGEKVKSFFLDDKCLGIEYSRGNLIVKSVGVYLTLNAESGKILNRITNINSCQKCVTVSDEKIYGCRQKDGVVYCFHADGDKFWQFENEMLKCPSGLTTDNEGFVYVTGKESNNVVVISPNGKNCKEILNKSHGLDVPRAIHFEKTLGLLLVCNEKYGAIICNIR